MSKQFIKLLTVAGTLTGLATVSSHAQACRQLPIATLAPDAAKRQLLQQFVRDCHQERYFFEDKGIMELLAYHDGKGREVWYLSAQIDDRYRDNPPQMYSMLGNDIILVYQADSTGRKSTSSPQQLLAFNDCLATVIGPAVYQRPAIKTRYVEEEYNGKIRRFRVQTMSNGNLWHERRIVFYKDGTYKVYMPA